MWTFAAFGGGIVGLLILGYYLGHKMATSSDLIAAKDAYIMRQTAILGAFVQAIKRGDNLIEFIEELDNATTPEQLTELYEQILKKPIK